MTGRVLMVGMIMTVAHAYVAFMTTTTPWRIVLLFIGIAIVCLAAIITTVVVLARRGQRSSRGFEVQPPSVQEKSADYPQ